MKFITNMPNKKVPAGVLKGIVVGCPQATDTQTYSQVIHTHYGIYLEEGYEIEDTFLAHLTEDSIEETPRDYRDIITSYNPPWGDYEVLWELWDCGYQEETDEDGVLYELNLNQNLYINGELIRPENIKERLDYIFRRTEE